MKPAQGKQVRILLVSFDYWPPDYGGELLHSIERFQALIARGHSVTVLTRRPPGYIRHERIGAIEVLRCPVPGRGLRARIAHLLWTAVMLWRTRYDVLHLGLMPARRTPTVAVAAWLFAGIARMRGARTYSVASLAEEGDVWTVSGRHNLVKKLHYRNVEKIIAVSPCLFEAIDSWWPGKSIFIPYAVRDDIFKPLGVDERRGLRAQFGVPEDGVVFITVGSAPRRKGHDLLAQAFAALAAKHRNWFLWFVGPRSRAEDCGTSEDDIAEMMAPLQQFNGQVRFFGRINDRSELRKLLGSSDVFVFPTRREGLPIAPMEGMAMSLPIIVSRIPGVTDVACVNQETGLLVPVNDASALALAMERLGTDAGLRSTFGHNARRRVEDRFSWRAHISAWEKLYLNGGSETNCASSSPA